MPETVGGRGATRREVTRRDANRWRGHAIDCLVETLRTEKKPGKGVRTPPLVYACEILGELR